ncbi:MAG TPA: dihydrofolate reductase family protein [Candidatus Limnocylindria bacterium]|jgi:riboflavin biosynthesis pyrimidine reductase
MADAPLVDRLWPDPRPSLPLDEAFSDLALPDPPAHRPLVGVNMISSVDGRAQLDGLADGLGSREDRRLMRLYRVGFDAVASGAGTLRADDFYSWLPEDLAQRRADLGRSPQPLAVVIGGSSAIPTDRRFFAHPEQPRAVVVGSDSPHAGEADLAGVEVWVAPTPNPEPGWVLGRLAERGVRTLLIEGGPTVNSSFLAAGALDELYWTVGPRLVAADGRQIVASLPDRHPPRAGSLVSAHRSGDELFLRYRFTGVEA